jgi:cytoskeleton protein RodZ
MMENPPENNSGQGNNPAAKKSSSTGSMLREARENLGLTVADVAGQIKFAPRQIEALEADDFKSLPEAAFLRGFVRSYAKILKLDPETLLANMPSAKAAAVELVPASVDVPFPSEQPNRQQNMIWLGAASLLAVLVAGFALWHYKTPLKETKQLAKEQTNATPVATPVETPVALPADAKIVSEPLVLKSSTIEPTVHPVPKPRSSAATSSVHEAKTLAAARAAKTAASKPASKAASQVPATLTAADAGAGLKTEELRLVFGEESWTEIKDKDGKIISSQVNPAGSELHVQGNPPFSMLIGHAASASLFYRGKQVDLKPHINKYSEVAHLTLK